MAEDLSIYESRCVAVGKPPYYLWQRETDTHAELHVTFWVSEYDAPLRNMGEIPWMRPVTVSVPVWEAISAISSLPGVRHIKLRGYCILIEKGLLFAWKPLQTAITDCFKRAVPPITNNDTQERQPRHINTDRG